MSITYKDEAGIAGMRTACRLASEVLDFLTPHIQPGVTTLEIDRLSAEYMKQQGTRSATIGYQPPGYPPYPGHLCTSVNHVVCHGIPNDKPLKKGDIVNVDVTVIKPGWYGDTSRMFLIGGETACSVQAKRLCQVTYEAMWKGIVMVKPGVRLGDIGHAIQTYAEATASRWCASSAATASASVPRRPAGAALRQARHAGRAQARHDLHHRAHDQPGQARHQGDGRRLDHRDPRPLAVGPVGTHRAGHRPPATRC
jgi:methionine aminopeptidase